MKGRTVFVCLIMLAIVVLLNLPVPASMRVRAVSRDAVEPYQNVMSFLIRKGRAMLSFVSRTGQAVDNVAELEQEIGRLKSQVNRLKSLKRQNAALRRQLGYKQAGTLELIPAVVVGRGDTSGWWQSIRLNKGLADGVESNRAVVAAGELVGRTTAVFERTCDVLLVTDPSCRIAARVPSAGERRDSKGIVNGAGMSATGREKIDMICTPAPCDMEYLPKYDRIRPGEEVLTSGDGGVFPADIPIGHIVSVERHESGLFQCAKVRPSADLSNLKYVFIVDRDL